MSQETTKMVTNQPTLLLCNSMESVIPVTLLSPLSPSKKGDFPIAAFVWANTTNDTLLLKTLYVPGHSTSVYT